MKKELLILGANSPLGGGVAEVLAQKEFDAIYLFARSFDNSSPLKSNIKQIISGDLSVEENVLSALDQVEPSKDKLLFLFSALGSFTGGKAVWETEVADLEKVLSINTKANFLIAKHFSSLVSKSAGGSICFTSAYTGMHPENRKAIYGLSKAALIHLVESLAIEGKEINLTANAIAPFIIDTPENRGWMKNTDFDTTLKPSEIGELIFDIFRNFNFITGNVIKLAGRLNLNFPY